MIKNILKLNNKDKIKLETTCVDHRNKINYNIFL